MEFVDKIIAYENGELTDIEIVELFSLLLRSGIINGLQGHYQRTAKSLIESGYLNKKTFEVTELINKVY